MNNQKKKTASRLKSTEPSSPERAWQYALRLLAAKDYTIVQLKQKLRAREFTDADLDQAVSRLEMENWISDRRFAERFAESALASGRFFGLRLRMEMLRRGFPEDVVSEVVGRLSDEFNEDVEAGGALTRHFPGFSFSEASDREKRRVLSFLQRRGFRTSVILRAMRMEVA
ncbi:MAG: regulatory protein RecX [Desulfuromonadales bacterium]|nr:regulatory protein RecX [Desulfuromonadales bacterium]